MHYAKLRWVDLSEDALQSMAKMWNEQHTGKVKQINTVNVIISLYKDQETASDTYVHNGVRALTCRPNRTLPTHKQTDACFFGYLQSF